MRYLLHPLKGRDGHRLPEGPPDPPSEKAVRRRRQKLTLTALLTVSVSISLFVSPSASATRGVDPFGCTLQANYPHVSGHNPGGINAGIVTQCTSGSPLWILQSAQLWETRFWGWDRIGTPGYGETYQKNYLETYAQANCRPGITLRLTANGRISDYYGHIYDDYTESRVVTIHDCYSGVMSIH